MPMRHEHDSGEKVDTLHEEGAAEVVIVSLE